MFNKDWRWIINGIDIPTEFGYCDQPSIVMTKDGVWVCSVTTGKGGEGAKGQYVNITRSSDQGKTWSRPIAIEDPQWESAYSSLAVAPSGRIYCFYCYNLDHVDIHEAGLLRYDMGGYYCYRISEDGGINWSNRHIVPVRDFAIDFEQPEEARAFHGKPLKFFWNVSRVFFDGDTCYSALIKYQYDWQDVLHRSEGVLLKCKGLDICSEQAVWQTLPDGTDGIRTPQGGGRVAEEQSFVKLSDGSLYCTYRTIDGHPAFSVSRDGGHTFPETNYLTYADGRKMKHNRAATFIWPLGDGKYLYWFNNHSIPWYNRRNPVWGALAVETPTPNGLTLMFSQPELLLYHDSEHVTMSYPDLLKDGDDWYLTETNKIQARIHRIDPIFLQKLQAQFTGTLPPVEEPVCRWKYGEPVMAFPELPFTEGTHEERQDMRRIKASGYALEIVWEDAHPGDILIDVSMPDGGISIRLNGQGMLAADIGDVMANCRVTGSVSLADGQRHHAVLILDVCANVGYFVTDGLMDDGGTRQRAGWRFLNRAIVSIPGTDEPKIGDSLLHYALYERALMSCEAGKLYTDFKHHWNREI